MLSKVHSAAVIGLTCTPVIIEVDIASQGLPSFTIVGLPDKAVEESKERVRAAIKNSGAEFPSKRITVNLAPADLPKNGPQYDIPIAIGILVASGQLPQPSNTVLFIGEVSLDGSLRHTNGILPVALFARHHMYTHIIVPAVDSREAAVVAEIAVIGAESLLDVYRHCIGIAVLEPVPPVSMHTLITASAFDCDMKDVAGQEQVKRSLEIAAAGGHNALMIGPPGSGKTMLARTLPTILPSLTADEALEVTNIYSITGNLPAGQSLITTRPFRAPHHTTSRIGLIGGGTHPMPGEVSLAHRGILFLDEFPEFPRHVLEALRQPIEDGFVSISRAAGTMVFPSQSMLIAAANPCQCGYFGSQKRRCTCSLQAALRYRKRISGPLIDRIDLHVTVPFVETVQLTVNNREGESSAIIRDRVQNARDIQTKRYNKAFTCNAELTTKATKQWCSLTSEATLFLKKAVDMYSLSARSYYRILKVSRTIADLAHDSIIQLPHVAEALQFRPTTE